MTTPIFAVQYLETLPAEVTSAVARNRLREACVRLPIDTVLLGSNLPIEFEEAIAEETARQGAQLYCWQPWLTGDSRTDLPLEWATVGPNNTRIPGYNNNPAFTFACPNHSGVADFLTERLECIAARGVFHGIFLDRIRFPSPFDDPTKHLGCFCKHCTHLAADASIDLELVRRCLQSTISNKSTAHQLVRCLLGKSYSPGSPLDAFLDFRSSSITRTVAFAKRQADSLGLSLGLDSFSPALTRMIGQDLQALDSVCDWIKLMTYPRVFGPAGLSFELLGLATWLVLSGWTEPEAMGILAEATGFSLPDNRAELRHAGLGSGTIAQEIESGRAQGVSHLLAGVALVEIISINESNQEQVQADIMATRYSDGLVISWDLWQTPLERLDIVHSLWETK
jgi:hypothetical protein